jgi:hypothetical protein
MRARAVAGTMYRAADLEQGEPAKRTAVPHDASHADLNYRCFLKGVLPRRKGGTKAAMQARGSDFMSLWAQKEQRATSINRQPLAHASFGEVECGSLGAAFLSIVLPATSLPPELSSPSSPPSSGQLRRP